MNDFSAISVQRKIMTLFTAKSKGFMTGEAMAHQTMRVEFSMDHLTDKMLIHLRAQVLQDPDEYEQRVLRFEEYPRYETWRAHLVDGLPTGSFRRRFLSRLWGFGDTETLRKRIIHEVVAERRLLFPNADVAKYYPSDMGQAGYVYQVGHNQYDEGEEYR